MEAIIKVTMFTKNQTVYLTDDNSATGFKEYQIELSELPFFVLNNGHIHTIHLMGHKDFCKRIKQEIQEEEFHRYKNNDIVISINE